MADYTEAQLAEAQAIVAAENQRLIAEAAAVRAAYLPAVHALVQSEGWAATLAAVTAIRAEGKDDGLLSIHVNALADIMPRLASLAG